MSNIPFKEVYFISSDVLCTFEELVRKLGYNVRNTHAGVDVILLMFTHLFKVPRNMYC